MNRITHGMVLIALVTGLLSNLTFIGSLLVMRHFRVALGQSEQLLLALGLTLLTIFVFAFVFLSIEVRYRTGHWPVLRNRPFARKDNQSPSSFWIMLSILFAIAVGGFYVIFAQIGIEGKQWALLVASYGVYLVIALLGTLLTSKLCFGQWVWWKNC